MSSLGPFMGQMGGFGGGGGGAGLPRGYLSWKGTELAMEPQWHLSATHHRPLPQGR